MAYSTQKDLILLNFFNYKCKPKCTPLSCFTKLHDYCTITDLRSFVMNNRMTARYLSDLVACRNYVVSPCKEYAVKERSNTPKSDLIENRNRSKKRLEEQLQFCLHKIERLEKENKNLLTIAKNPETKIRHISIFRKIESLYQEGKISNEDQNELILLANKFCDEIKSIKNDADTTSKRAGYDDIVGMPRAELQNIIQANQVDAENNHNTTEAERKQNNIDAEIFEDKNDAENNNNKTDAEKYQKNTDAESKQNEIDAEKFEDKNNAEKYQNKENSYPDTKETIAAKTSATSAKQETDEEKQDKIKEEQNDATSMKQLESVKKTKNENNKEISQRNNKTNNNNNQLQKVVHNLQPIYPINYSIDKNTRSYESYESKEKLINLECKIVCLKQRAMEADRLKVELEAFQRQMIFIQKTAQEQIARLASENQKLQNQLKYTELERKKLNLLSEKLDNVMEENCFLRDKIKDIDHLKEALIHQFKTAIKAKVCNKQLKCQLDKDQQIRRIQSLERQLVICQHQKQKTENVITDYEEEYKKLMKYLCEYKAILNHCEEN